MLAFLILSLLKKYILDAYIYLYLGCFFRGFFIVFLRIFFIELMRYSAFLGAWISLDIFLRMKLILIIISFYALAHE